MSPSRKPAAGSREAGFVLPTTLMVMTLMTVMLTAAFTMVSAEYRTTDNSFARARAYALAQAGLQTYYSLTRNVGNVTYDSVRLTLTGGYVDVVARRLRDSTPADDALWMVRATGSVSDPYQPGQVAAQRVVTQLAVNQVGFPSRAVLYAANGLTIVNYAVTPQITVHGDDNCTNASVPTLIYPSGRYSVVNVTTPNFGSPSPIIPAPTALSSAAAVYDAMKIDWVALTSGQVAPDFVVPGSTPTWNTGSIILVNGDFTLTQAMSPYNNAGRGILIVTGNLTLSDAGWEGVIIVGGRLIAASTRYSLHGTVYTGLNIALGQTVQPDSIWRGNAGDRQLRWDSCEYRTGVGAMTALMALPNTFSNTWATY